MPEAALAPASRKDDTLRLAAIMAALGVGGYLAYRYIYLPKKLEDDIRARMLAAGQPMGNPLSVLGAGACSALGASYGIPPQASVGICGQLGQAVSQVLPMIPGLVNDTGMALGNTVGYLGGGLGSAVGSIGGGVGSAVGSIGGGIGAGVAGAAGGIAGAAVSLGSVPIKILGNTVTPVYNGAKTVVKDVTSGLSAVGNGIAHAFSSIF